MAKIGKCVNIDCDHYKEEFDIQAGEEFVCPHCKKPLSDIECKASKKMDKSKGPNWKPIAIIMTCVLVLGGFGAYMMLSGPKGPTDIRIDKKELTMKVGETQKISAIAEPKDEKVTFNFTSKNKNVEVNNDGEVNALQEGEDSIIVQCEENKELIAICKVIVESVDEPGPQGDSIETIVASAKAKADSIIAANEKLLEEKGKKIREDAKKVINTQLTSLRTVCQTLQFENIALIDTMEVAINECWKNADQLTPTSNTGRNPSWGRYEGPRQNGLPNGSGILYINRTTTINGQTARPGERIEGVFRNGYVNMGTWFKNDGNTVVVKDFKVL